MIAYKITVRGKVQRVGYMMYMLDNAQRLKIHGYVKNNPDGSVEIFAQGDEDRIDRFIKLIRDAPKPIVVENIDISASSTNPDIKIFEIISRDLSEELQEGFGAMQSIFMKEFGEYREEFRDFVNRTDNNFKIVIDELKEIRGEVRQTREEVKQVGEEVKLTRNEIRDFANKTDNNFNTLLIKYGEISDKLTLILDELRREREESNKRFEMLQREILDSKKDLKRSIDTLIELVRSKI